MGWFAVKPLQAMSILRKSVFIIGTIPPRRTDSARTYLLKHALWTLCILCSGIVLAALIGTIIVHSNEPFIVLQIIPILTILGIIEMRHIIWKKQWRSLQIALEEWENFIINATPEEEKVMQKYAEEVGPFHIFLFLLIPPTLTAYIIMPAFTSANLPVLAEFPFDTTTGAPMWFVIYLLEAYGTFTSGAAAAMDMIMILLLWSMSARFEMLHTDVRKIKTIDDVRKCVEKQRRLIAALEELKGILNWMGFTITLVVLIGVSTGGFIVINRTVQKEIIFFLLAMSMNTMQLFTYCWAGDSLMETSQGIVNACFNADWADASPEVQQCLRIMMEGSRRPLVMSVDGLLPVMSLEYFSSSMSAVISYITTLRAFTQ